MTDEELMRAALDEAREAAALGEVPVGAVVAKDGEIIARAHNLRESGKNATYHAELMAIDAACKALGGWRLWQCELFVTLEPCPMCSGAIINSRLKRVVYGARDPKAGCCGSLTDLFALPFNHHPVIESGLLEEEAQALLQDFFAMLREKRKKKSMRNVFLTGGSRGIGAAAVLALARAGYNVAFTYQCTPRSRRGRSRPGPQTSPLPGRFCPSALTRATPPRCAPLWPRPKKPWAVCRYLSAMRASPSKSCLPTLPTRIGTA